MRLLEQAYRKGWVKERKLHLIWRAIARRRNKELDWLVEFHNGIEAIRAYDFIKSHQDNSGE